MPLGAANVGLVWRGGSVPAGTAPAIRTARAERGPTADLMGQLSNPPLCVLRLLQTAARKGDHREIPLEVRLSTMGVEKSHSVLGCIDVPLCSRLRKALQVIVVSLMASVLKINKRAGNSSDVRRDRTNALPCTRRDREELPHA